jgi:metal-dependent amidase/aminoacylase/carboxypeptidase family protein
MAGRFASTTTTAFVPRAADGRQTRGGTTRARLHRYYRRWSHGFVGILKNGDGPVVMLRTELDALPVEEKTGLPYASTVRTKDDNGADVGVMHACGHESWPVRAPAGGAH